MAQTTQSGSFPIAAIITDAQRGLHLRRQLHQSLCRADKLFQADGNKGIAQTQTIAQRLTEAAAR